MTKLKRSDISLKGFKVTQASDFTRLIASVHPDDAQLFRDLETYCSKLENKLVAVEHSYQELYEFSPVCYLDLDKDNYIIRANLTCAQLFGTSRGRLVGTRFPAFIGKDSQPILQMCLQQVFTTQIKKCCELEFLKDDGSSFYGQVESTMAIDPSNNISCLRLVIIDISEHRLVEQALKSSEEKFRFIVETTKEWVWTIDLTGCYLYSNPAVTNILGYPISELLNHNRLLLIHKDDRLIVSKTLLSSTKNKCGWNDLILRLRCKNGSYRYLESNAVPFFDRKGELLGFRGADRDITLFKQAEEQVLQHQAALVQTSRLNFLGELASTLAHELAQPLTAVNNFIAGCIKRLNAGTSSKKVLLDALQYASQQAERAGQIAHRMKYFLLYGKMHCETVDINELISESIAFIKKEFPVSAVKIRFKPIGSRVFIIADKIQLQQVILNLLRNGIEIMADYATLNPQLQVKCIICSDLNFPTQGQRLTCPSEQQVLISVVDNGPGFCFEGGLDKLFEACFTTKVNSLGIGLAISGTIIEAHGGLLSAYRNLPDKGACFEILLPMKQDNDKS